MAVQRDEIPRTSAPLATRLTIGALVVAVAGGLAWYFSGDGLVAPPAAPSPEDPNLTETVAMMKVESLELEEAYDDEVTATDIPTPEQLRLLENALHAQEDFVRQHPSPAWGDRERVRLLQVKLATARGRGWLADSEKFEQQSVTLLAAGDRAGGLAALQEALRLQREINTSGADATVRRAAREAELAARLETFEAEPLAREVDRLEAEAQSSVTAGDLAAAARLYYEAANFQRRINDLYGRTRFASASRLDRLDSEIASLGAVELARERDRLIDQAAELDRNGVAATAANLLAQARDLQARINREFAQSRDASSLRWDELEVSRQTVASRPRVTAFNGLVNDVRIQLRNGRVDEARTLIERATSDAAALSAEFPRSRLLEAGWREAIDFLASTSPVLTQIQAEVNEHLRPVPGTSLSLLTNEVSQRLYAAVSGGNPSRVQGNRLPVESVTVAEALEFCRRLSWALGRTVRLPARAEFAAALHAAGADVWSAENSGNVPRGVEAGEPNAAGFRNLAGNIAEWVQGEGEGNYLAAGGSYADPALLPNESVFRPLAATERFRHVGFRIIVE